MTTKDIINQMEKEFDDVAYHEVVYGNPTGRVSGGERIGFTKCKRFLRKYSRKLLKQFSKEILNTHIELYREMSAIELIDSVIRQQRLKMKEVISSLEK